MRIFLLIQETETVMEDSTRCNHGTACHCYHEREEKRWTVSAAGILENWASGKYLDQYRLHASGPSTAKVCKTLILNLLVEGKIYNLYTSVTFSTDESGHVSLSCRHNNHVCLWLNTSAVKSPPPNGKHLESRCLKAAALHFSTSSNKEPRRLWFSLFSKRTKDRKKRDWWL